MQTEPDELNFGIGPSRGVDQLEVDYSSNYSNRLDQLLLRKANDLGWSTTKQTGDSHNNKRKA